MLYFAYGSNLFPGRSAAGLTLVSPACLPDFRLGFTRRAQGWKGGVLDVVESLGSVVEGALFEVADPAELDRQEGSPYRRRVVTVLVQGADGMVPTPAFLYEVVRKQVWVSPSEDYLALVRSAYEQFRFDTWRLDAAAANRAASPLPIFVYGTLLRGESREKLLPGTRFPARVPGQLFVLAGGAYPGCKLSGRPDSYVQGEMVEVDDVPAVLRVLDRVEGFRGHGVSGSLFVRTLATVEVGLGHQLAWTYQHAGGDEDCRIVGGSWRGRFAEGSTAEAAIEDIRRFALSTGPVALPIGAADRALPDPEPGEAWLERGTSYWGGAHTMVTDGPVYQRDLSWTHTADPIVMSPHARALGWVMLRLRDEICEGDRSIYGFVVEAVNRYQAAENHPSEFGTLNAALEGVAMWKAERARWLR